MKSRYLKLSFLAIALTITVDQIAKGALLYMITGGVPMFGPAFDVVPYPYMISHVTSFFNIIFTWNPGTAFSLFRSLGEMAPVALILLTGALIVFLCVYLCRRVRHPVEHIAFSLIIGGAIGNLIDRLRFGAVVDFLDFHINTWHWPAFNFADIFISIGIGILIISWLFFNKKS